MTPRVRQYVAEAAQQHGVSAEAVMGPSRKSRVCAARWGVMRRLSGDGFSTTQIGRWLNRDHSTVVHALQLAA